MTELPTAYDDGFDARLAGESLDDNPYPPHFELWDQWRKGWVDQDHHLNQRFEVLGR